MVSNQAQLFLIFTINGIIIGILFDIFRVLRRSFRTSDGVTYLEDFMFWILTGIILLYSIFTFSDGEIRFYMFIGIFIGALLYMLFFSKNFIKINVKITKFLSKLIYKLFSIIIVPFKFLRKIFIKPIKIVIINLKKVNFKKIFKSRKKEISTWK